MMGLLSDSQQRQRLLYSFYLEDHVLTSSGQKPAFQQNRPIVTCRDRLACPLPDAPKIELQIITPRAKMN